MLAGTGSAAVCGEAITCTWFTAAGWEISEAVKEPTVSAGTGSTFALSGAPWREMSFSGSSETGACVPDVFRTGVFACFWAAFVADCTSGEEASPFGVCGTVCRAVCGPVGESTGFDTGIREIGATVAGVAAGCGNAGVLSSDSSNCGSAATVSGPLLLARTVRETTAPVSISGIGCTAALLLETAVDGELFICAAGKPSIDRISASATCFELAVLVLRFAVTF